MATVTKPVFPIQVRELVEFVLRRGGLGGERDFTGSTRALAGIRGHHRIQRSRPAGYQKELALNHEVEAKELILRVQGRLDGLLISAAEVLLEEIKTTQGPWDRTADPLHWAQVKCYGFIYAHDHALEDVTLQLTYLNLDTDEQTEFRERFAYADLTAFFGEITKVFLEWIQERHHWCQLRDQSIRALHFPFPHYRPGQRQLAVAAYRTLARGGRLYLEAPTGIGKTISVVFPALKALAEGKLERIFYLTARTVGRLSAEQALTELRPNGLRLRALTLTAKEKLCFQAGAPCDPGSCPFARGYYDRRWAAVRALLVCEWITRPVLETVALEHQVCPFELALDASLWVDVIVGDYNYLFDPKVYLRRHFSETAGAYAFLVDEAHNLVDRAREMFSAELELTEINQVRQAIRKPLPRCAKTLARLSSALRKLIRDPEAAAGQPADSDSAPELELFPLPRMACEAEPALDSRRASPEPETNDLESTRGDKSSVQVHASGALVLRQLPAWLAPLLADALATAEAWLAQNRPAEFREALLELYFHLHSFLRTSELYDERYVTLVEPGSATRVRLFCLHPSFLLAQALTRGKAAIFFSATLTPLPYYRDLLGGQTEDPILQLPSPFAPDHLAVLVHRNIRTHLKARAETLLDVVQTIGALVGERRGNYLVYFPSYQYLEAVRAQFQTAYPAIPVLVQRPGLSEPEREAFLAAFASGSELTLVGFAVMGGIFGEGIDLVGERLIGAIIVGVGLPQLGLERDLIRDYYQEQNGAGFDYAYTFPGMNRVLQAAGRVIRSETDRGVVLLLDARFNATRYRCLFPAWWQPTPVTNDREIQAAARQFWQRA